jgi:hypothetical protein
VKRTAHTDQLADDFLWMTSGLLADLLTHLTAAFERCIGTVEHPEDVEYILPYRIDWTNDVPSLVVLKVKLFDGTEHSHVHE